jgi:hypothetical protein
MSDQAEYDAKLQALNTLGGATRDKDLLEGKLKNLGKFLEDFAQALKRPDEYVFDVANDAITVGKPGGQLGRPIARLTPLEMNWDDLRETLQGYVKAKADKRDCTAALGLPHVP